MPSPFGNSFALYAGLIAIAATFIMPDPRVLMGGLYLLALAGTADFVRIWLMFRRDKRKRSP